MLYLSGSLMEIEMKIYMSLLMFLGFAIQAAAAADRTDCLANAPYDYQCGIGSVGCAAIAGKTFAKDRDHNETACIDDCYAAANVSCTGLAYENWYSWNSQCEASCNAK